MTHLKKLSVCALTTREQQNLLQHITALSVVLGAPGDWGYGTRLGDLTLELLSLRAAVQEAPTREQLDAAKESVDAGGMGMPERNADWIGRVEAGEGPNAH